MMKQVVGYGLLVSVTILCAIAVDGFLHVSEATRVAAAALPGAGVETGPSCAAPDAVNVERCREMEAQILATTLRLHIQELAPKEGGGYEVVDNSVGHATVIGGRYLVTHNHFSLSMEDEHDGHLRRLSAYGAVRSIVIQDASFDVFDLLVVEPQTMVLDFGASGAQGALADYGFTSADFADWQTLGLQAGDEVAQVNWDGRTTSVEWVRVSRVRDQDGRPALELENYVAQGASGGGIFYEGYHVGNNWFHGATVRAKNGDELRRFTVGALNGDSLLALALADEDSAPEATAPALAAWESIPELDAAGLLSP